MTCAVKHANIAILIFRERQKAKKSEVLSSAFSREEKAISPGPKEHFLFTTVFLMGAPFSDLTQYIRDTMYTKSEISNTLRLIKPNNIYSFVKISSSLLLKSISGNLILLLVAYLLLKQFAEIKPLTPSELMLFLVNLENNEILSVTSSIITIFGFLFAFRSTTESWKNQLLSQIKIQAANDFNMLFNNININIINCELYLIELNETIQLIKKHNDKEFIKKKVFRFLKKNDNFHNDIKQISHFVPEVISLSVKHNSIINSVIGINELIGKSSDVVRKIVDNSLIFRLPNFESNEIEDIIFNISLIDQEKLMHSISCNKKLYPLVSVLGGRIYDKLMTPIIGVTLNSWINTIAIQRKYNNN